VLEVAHLKKRENKHKHRHNIREVYGIVVGTGTTK